MAWLNEWINLDKPGKDNTVCMYIAPLAYQYLGHQYCMNTSPFSEPISAHTQCHHHSSVSVL